jgi:oxygen-independent coproporphyrinogen-3 oxidase
LTPSTSSAEGIDLDRILSVLGPAAAVSYAPPNIYPMSAPRFTSESGVERPHPSGLEFGIYAHIPFCSYHCTFCFYATRVGAALDDKRRYVEGLESELEWLPANSRLSQLYVGGGTPTALPPDLLDRVLAAVFQRMAPAGRHVHTVETSPETLTDEHVAVVKRHGIERMSMGVQSLDDGVLDTIHRRHTREMVEASCQRLLDAGLMVNVDLIYGLPGQTPDDFRRDLAAVAGFGVQSVTAYNLRVNERTPVARSLAADERLDLTHLVRWRATVMATAREHGFVPKRWHTFQRMGKGPAAEVVSRFDDVTGHGNQFSVGMSARSRLNHVVFRNHSGFDAYLERVEGGRSPVEETFALSEPEQKLRFITLTLGDGQALPRTSYQAEFGSSLETDFPEPLSRLFEAGLIEEADGAIGLTANGQLLHDLVTRAFYPETVRRWMEERQALAATARNLRPRARRGGSAPVP